MKSRSKGRLFWVPAKLFSRVKRKNIKIILALQNELDLDCNMNKFSTARLTRISKATARKLWGKKDMSLCPCKLRPDGPWRPNLDIFAAEITEKQKSEYDFDRARVVFDTFLQNFEWYNCQMNETGYYTAFYLIK